jgi:hypothetical protein
MPIGFLPPADRDRLNHFPVQIPDDDLRAFFCYRRPISR